jgi:phytoene dehydrogenase-like protein
MNCPAWQANAVAILRAMNRFARRFANRLLPLSVTVTVSVLMSACSQQPPAPPTQPSASAQAAANEAAAAKELKLYQDMLAQHAEDLAAPVGKDILQKYPGTPAAAEVQKTLTQVEATAKSKAEYARLAALWWYQTANVEGLQHTASIYSSEPSGAKRVRLVLRRHVKWGQSVYLFAPDGSKGFVCKDLCNVATRFDGKRETWKAYLPKTGEPAMFIKDDKRFIAAMQKAKVIEMDVTTRDQGKETLKFEVGGYDPSRFAPMPKKK